MKQLLRTTLAALSMASIANAASYASDFEETLYPASGTDFNGFDGWTVSESTSDLASIVTAASSNWGMIGGFYDIPVASSVTVSHDFTSTVGRIVYDLDFSVIDTISAFPNRDAFGISVFGAGSTNIFTVNFTPNDPTPADADADSNATWSMSYTAVGSTVPLNLSVQEDGVYGLSISFDPNGADTSFSLAVDDGINAPFERNGNLAMDPLTEVNSIGFSWSPTTTGSEGAGALIFDNISIVPEPSSCLLFGLAGLGFVFRRVRG